MKFEGLKISPFGLALLDETPAGSMETEAMDAPEFDWLVPWWNADIAGAGAVELFLQVESAAEWSRWYSMGRWSHSPASSSDRDEIGKVETDTLILVSKAKRFKLRVDISAGEEGTGSAIVKRLGLITRDRERERSPARPYLLQETAMTVPRRSQMIEAADIRGRICSPTCDAMALQLLGIDLPTAFVAADCYDTGAKIYGNWPFNVASLWRLGAVARLDYFVNMEMAVGELRAGHPLIASIKFAEGALAGAPIAKTNGHLVLIAGLARDESGAFLVLVNDPASASIEGVSRRYDLQEFEKAWTGIVYVIEGKR
jgi:hypothetical protein